MVRILIIEDSFRLRNYIGDGLILSGFAVDKAKDGEEGLWMAQSNEYDAIILDLMLPKLDGISLMKRLRGDGIKTHILILTAKDTVDDRVLGLDEGADDYLIKPFALDELVARVKALVRRNYGVKSPKIRIGDLEIDAAQRSVMRSGELISLTSREYALLEYLALRKGQVISRTDIEEHIYDDRAEVMSNVIDSFVYRLRKKIEPPDGPALIRTRRGMGYVLEEPKS